MEGESGGGELGEEGRRKEGRWVRGVVEGQQ